MTLTKELLHLVLRSASQKSIHVVSVNPILSRHLSNLYNSSEKGKETQENGRRPRMVTIPNVLTSSRIIMTPAIGYFICNEMHLYAFSCFIIAALTDLVDGLIARHMNQCSDIGAILDPIADKLLLTTCFVSLYHIDLMPFWLVGSFVFRDIALLGGGIILRYRSFGARPTLKQYINFNKYPAPDFQPTLLSKCNTALQCSTIVVHLGGNCLVGSSAYYDLLVTSLHALTATTTLASFGQYLTRAVVQESDDMIETNTIVTCSNQQRPLLVLINPHSGRGKSVKIFEKQVLKILKSNHVKHDIFVTTTDLRVRQYLLSKSFEDLIQYKAIMVIGGDGLLYETVNAILTRQDWQQTIDIPVGVIPTGSGNGLAYTMINSSQMSVKCQSEAVKVCCEQIIKADKSPCDLVKLSYGKDKTTIWSFLSIGWGLLADIDIDSEWLRCFGEFRFTIYGVLRSLTSVSYRGKLSIKIPSFDQDDKETMRIIERLKSESDTINVTANIHEHIEEHSFGHGSDVSSEWVHIEDEFVCLYAVHQPYVNSATNFSPKSSLTDQLTYLTYIRGTLNIYQVIEFLLAIEDGSHEKLSYVRVVPVQSFKFQPLQPSKVVVDGEVIPWTIADGPISAEIVPKVLNIAWSKHNDAQTI